MKYLYPLGAGCYPYKHAQNFPSLNAYMSPHVIFKGFQTVATDTFLPLALFDGTLRKEFETGNFQSGLCEGKIAPEDVNNFYKEKARLTVDLPTVNPKTGFCITHMENRNTMLFSKEHVKARFDWFDIMKRKFVYVITFERAGYQFYTREHIRKFELYLAVNGFDFGDFYYVDFGSSDLSRFDGCGIRLVQVPQAESQYMFKQNRDPLDCAVCWFYWKYQKQLLEKLRE